MKSKKFLPNTKFTVNHMRKLEVVNIKLGQKHRLIEFHRTEVTEKNERITEDKPCVANNRKKSYALLVRKRLYIVT